MDDSKVVSKPTILQFYVTKEMECRSEETPKTSAQYFIVYTLQYELHIFQYKTAHLFPFNIFHSCGSFEISNNIMGLI